MKLIAQNSVLINAAMRKQTNSSKVAEKWLAHNTTKAVTPEDVQSAKNWVKINVQMDSIPLKNALKKVYGSSWAFGATDAKNEISSEIGFDWDEWEPGREAAAVLADAPRGLRTMLDRRGATIKGIDDTTLDRIGSSLALSLSQGLGAEETANMIDYILDDPARSMVIARTETADALVQANVAEYKDNEITQIEWLVGDPCEICAENAGQIVDIGEEFSSGDQYPPAHPNCVCDVSPVVSFSQGEDVELSASADLNKYDPDQPRDENGRWGSGGGGSDVVVTDQNDALNTMWSNVITTISNPESRSAVLEGVGESGDTEDYERAVNVEAFIKDSSWVASEVKATIAQDITTAMADTPTENLISAALGEGAGIATANAEDYGFESAMTPQVDETTDADGNPSGINVVELNGNGDINIYNYADIIDTQGLTSGSVTVDQVRDGVEAASQDSADFRYAVAGSPEAEAFVREASVSLLINNWAQTSNDENPTSHALQTAAQEQFGLTNAAKWENESESLKWATDKIYEANGQVYRDFLQAQYDNTQTNLKAAGIESLVLYRGSGGGEPGEAEINTRPMSSWSTSFLTAFNFAPTSRVPNDPANGVIYRTEIPASEIMSTAGTGFGCLREFEVVALGGPRQAIAIDSGDAVGIENITEEFNVEPLEAINELFGVKK